VIPKLTKEAADDVDPHGAGGLPLFAAPVEGEDRLLVAALDCHRLDAGGTERLQESVAVDPVSLVALSIQPNVAGGQQRDLKAQPDEVPRPVMGGAACFHDHLARRA
jgi:hypothetical protein